jgi:hypothetical protein
MSRGDNGGLTGVREFNSFCVGGPAGPSFYLAPAVFLHDVMGGIAEQRKDFLENCPSARRAGFPSSRTSRCCMPGSRRCPGGRYRPAASPATPVTARIETRTLKTAHVGFLDFPHACQAIKITRWRKDTATGKVSRETANLATIRAAIIAAIKDAGYLHVPEGRRDHTTPAEILHLHGLD